MNPLLVLTSIFLVAAGLAGGSILSDPPDIETALLTTRPDLMLDILDLA
jgi:hypothetical protein